MKRKPDLSAAHDEDTEDWDEGHRFFAGAILAIPYGLAIWIALWCIWSKTGCTL